VPRPPTPPRAPCGFRALGDQATVPVDLHPVLELEIQQLQRELLGSPAEASRELFSGRRLPCEGSQNLALL
jgi:hypothetical protein